MDFSRTSVARFLDGLGSEAVSPGGGSAAALVGATAAALLEMVCRLNNKRERNQFGRVGKETEKRPLVIGKIRARLARLVTLDAEAFRRLAAFPKGENASGAYQKALKESAGAALEMCELSVKILKLGLLEIPRTSRWLRSDLTEAGLFSHAAFLGGRMNVEANLKDLKDRPYAARLGLRLRHLAAEADAAKRRMANGRIRMTK